jgi:hypothetical protein
MMGEGLIWYLLMTALVIVPFWQILPRNGISKYYAFLALIPVGAIILLWIVAFRDQFADRTKG